MFDKVKVELWEGKTYMFWVVKHICFRTLLQSVYYQIVTSIIF